jgi:hypothetical protein
MIDASDFEAARHEGREEIVRIIEAGRPPGGGRTVALPFDWLLVVFSTSPPWPTPSRGAPILSMPFDHLKAFLTQRRVG